MTVAAGAGEILLTFIDIDGTMSGYDAEKLREMADAVPIPVIGSGGAGMLKHLADAVQGGDASAVARGSLCHFTSQSPFKARSFMRVAGIDVRAEG